MKRLISVVVLFALVATVAVWFSAQRAAMHTVGGHPSPAYCSVLRIVGYPTFQRGEVWRCELVRDGMG